MVINWRWLSAPRLAVSKPAHSLSPRRLRRRRFQCTQPTGLSRKVKPEKTPPLYLSPIFARANMGESNFDRLSFPVGGTDMEFHIRIIGCTVYALTYAKRCVCALAATTLIPALSTSGSRLPDQQAGRDAQSVVQAAHHFWPNLGL